MHGGGYEVIRDQSALPLNVGIELREAHALRPSHPASQVNNAGVGAVGPLTDLPIGAMRQVFETNVYGTVAMSQALFPIMAKQGAGTIANIGSIVGWMATPWVRVFVLDILMLQPGFSTSSSHTLRGRVDLHESSVSFSSQIEYNRSEKVGNVRTLPCSWKLGHFTFLSPLSPPGPPEIAVESQSRETGNFQSASIFSNAKRISYDRPCRACQARRF